ncbi:MAG: hypothetical protein SD837_15625 [Candidatus Electrothrix scaldis]|nr:MAG: hypothetical protein SD837_15625 [Candidatus Electrothrix sp. GW3-3]
MSSVMIPHSDAIYYHIAKKSLEKAKELSKEKVETIGGLHKEKMENVAVALVFSALCLEAFINQAYYNSTREELEKEPKKKIEDKWLSLPKLLGYSETFDIGKQPYQTFNELIYIRNNRMIHPKPKCEKVVTKIINPARDRSPEELGRLVRETTELFVDLHKEPSHKKKYLLFFLDDIKLCDKYFLCIEKMIRELSRLTDNEVPIPIFLEKEIYETFIA